MIVHDDEAVAPIVATVLLVAITLVVASLTMVMVMQFTNVSGNAPYGAISASQRYSDSQFEINVISLPGSHQYSEFRMTIDGVTTTDTLDNYINPVSFVNPSFSLFVVDFADDGKVGYGDYLVVSITRGVGQGEDWTCYLLHAPSGGLSAECAISLGAFNGITPAIAWDFSEGYGKTTNDTTGNPLLTGTITGYEHKKVRWMTGNGANALEFLNTAGGVPLGYLSIPDSAMLRPLTQISLEAWIYPEASGTQKIVQKGDWDGYGIGLDKYKGFFCAVTTTDQNGASVNMGHSIVLNKWYHVCMTFDGTTLSLYVDGSKISSAVITGDLSYKLVRSFSMGSDSGTQKAFYGMIGHVHLYSSALSSDQVASVFNANKGVFTGTFQPIV